jgi:hypothetical protein
MARCALPPLRPEADIMNGSTVRRGTFENAAYVLLR